MMMSRFPSVQNCFSALGVKLRAAAGRVAYTLQGDSVVSQVHNMSEKKQLIS